jgi:hypothetical protein
LFGAKARIQEKKEREEGEEVFGLTKVPVSKSTSQNLKFEAFLQHVLMTERDLAKCKELILAKVAELDAKFIEQINSLTVKLQKARKP